VFLIDSITLDGPQQPCVIFEFTSACTSLYYSWKTQKQISMDAHKTPRAWFMFCRNNNILPPSHFFVPRVVPKFPQIGSLEPRAGYPKTEKKKLGASRGFPGDLWGSFFIPTGPRASSPKRLPGNPREAPSFCCCNLWVSPQRLQGTSLGNLGTTRGTKKWDGGSR
jgi:hypothetical protein